MKKTILIILSIVIVAFALSSCSSSHIKIGTYYYHMDSYSAAVTLKDDNTFVFVESYSQGISYSGIYSVNDNILTLKTTDKESTASYVFTIEKNTLKFNLVKSTPLSDKNNVDDNGVFTYAKEK